VFFIFKREIIEEAIVKERNSETAAKAFVALLLLAGCMFANAVEKSSLEDASPLQVKVNSTDGKYSILMPRSSTVALRAGVGAQVDGRWLHATDYPQHTIKQSQVKGYLGIATDWQVTYSGLSGEPDLVYHLRTYLGKPFGDIQVTVENTTGKPIRISDIRSVDVTEDPVLDLGGPAREDRVLSDVYSENGTSRDDSIVPSVRNLADSPHKVHRAVGSQLIYNLQSHQSLFIGALTSERFLTILRLHLAKSNDGSLQPASYEVDSTGTTELAIEASLKDAPAQDRVQLSLPIEPGASLSSEQLFFSLSTDYHHQLDTYGSVIRDIHHARVSAPPLMGWWSWAPYFYGLNEGAALTNAQWEAEHLKPLGYNTYLVDEGYAYARGEYTTPNASLFPHGMASVFNKVHGLGLMPAIWTAPFEVSERSWVYEHHRDWLVKNADGEPIHVGWVTDWDSKDPKKDALFVLDTTNPEAQGYLRTTYSTLVNEWGIRVIKLDFMDTTLVEGYYFRPNTTALEAQRIGLQIIRDAVGPDVYLDKDGSPMLNAVGYVDYGRTSLDTGHVWGSNKDAASGIAARYYMNRNFYVADPDAFEVSTQTVKEDSWHGYPLQALTLNEAKAFIALAAVSGGMFEIGDDLSVLYKEPERLALIKNQDLINMIRLGKASVPVDLMNYESEDEQPSIFLLKESARQSILTVFNWTDKDRAHLLHLDAIALSATGRYTITDVLDKNDSLSVRNGELSLHLPPHSVRVLKIVDEDISVSAPTVATDHPSNGNAGDTLAFSARDQDDNPVLSYQWDFGDGVTLEGKSVSHT
jgi:hypothetical protein